MNDDPMNDDPTEWTDEERAALGRLERETDPGRLLEERTVRALRGRGLLGASAVGPAGRDGAGTRLPVKRDAKPRARTGRRRPHPAWWAAGVAASLALFLGGMTVGQRRADASTQDLVEALRAADAAERAALVQRTGTLWVEALTGLVELQAQGDDESVETGAEVARAALRAAALELARLHPDDVRYARILSTLDPPGGGADAAGGGERARQVHWF